MDIYSKMVLMKGKDYTEKVTQIERLPNHYTKIILDKGKEYTPKNENVYIADLRQGIDLKNKILFCDNKPQTDAICLLDFGENYRVIYKSKKHKVYPHTSIRLENDLKKMHRELWNYWCEIARYAKIGEKDGEFGQTFLERALQSIAYIHPDSVLAQYIRGEHNITQYDDIPLIFPFDFNQSQQEAITQALCDSISIIEGPPGTGKTQTIINLLSNLVGERNLTVAMVSGTNEAVRNVQEKMENAGYGFLLANLGKKVNQKNFFENPPHPDLELLLKQGTGKGVGEIAELNKLFLRERKKAQLEQHLADYELEFEHFSRYYQTHNYQKIENLSVSKLSAKKMVCFLAETQLNIFQNKRKNFLYKLKLFVKYRFKEFSLMNKDEIRLVLEVQNHYYLAKIAELKGQIKQIEIELSQANFLERKNTYQENSKKLFNTVLAERYTQMQSANFSQNSFKQNFHHFLEHYPVVLSTTYSIINSIPERFLFDYLIIDESSQVDLLSGILALSCCKHAVIVGDIKQLPQIVDENIKKKMITHCPDPAYDYFQHSILSSMIAVFRDKVSRKLLREHYRCEPAIINFCNNRYYNGELIVLKRATEENPLVLYQTSKGNHMRTITRGKSKGRFNQRELDTILAEVLTDPDSYSAENIGFTTPYVKQAQKASNLFPEELECDTIHKYQGRQKEIMILSTVLDNTRYGHIALRFVDDPHKINVAVSRAERQFILVSDKTFFETSAKEIKALIGYMEYELLDSTIIESKVVSVFDLLYQDYSRTLLDFGRRLPSISRYRSENIMYQLLSDILEEQDYKDYSFAFQVLLKNLIKDFQLLSEKECEYVNHRASVDFVVYRKTTKKPVLVIEVDGFASHENNPVQQERDRMKNHILDIHKITLLRLPTTGSQESEKIRRALNA